MIESSVVIPTYNRQESLQILLESLAIQTMDANNFEVIVVDDGSPKASMSLDQSSFPFPFKFIRQTNQGATAARNNGALRSQGKILVFIDDDIKIERHALAAITKACIQKSKIIALGNLELCNTNTDSTFSKIAISLESLDQDHREAPDQTLDYVACNTQFLAIARRDFFDLGMLQDPTGGWPNWDDVDLGYRAHLAGFKVIRVQEAKGQHWDNSLSDRNSTSQRWFRASKSAVLLFQRYPDLQSTIPMYEDMMPINWEQDSRRLITRKVFRRFASTQLVLSLMERVTDLLLVYYPNPDLLLPMYRWVFGGYKYKGYQEGLREYGFVPEPSNLT